VKLKQCYALTSLTPFFGSDHGFVEALFTPANNKEMKTDNAISIRLPGPITASVDPIVLLSVKVWLKAWDSPIS
jgi:hypothetical protein